jgi:hypothetical protein
MRDHLKTGQVRQAGGNLHVNPNGFRVLDEAPSLSAICPPLLETGETLAQTRQQPTADGAIVVVRFADQGFEHETFGVHHQIALAPFDLLAASIAAYAPFSVVLTDWRSILPALGVLSRPSCRRSCSRRASFIRAQVPSLRQVLKSC